jgi:hypothetical protein
LLSEQLSVDGGASVVDQVEKAGETWKAYMGSMKAPCLHPGATSLSDPYSVGYATRHDPFVYYPPIVNGAANRCANHVVNYNQLGTDLKAAKTTPNYVFITPDTCDDGHDAPCADGRPGGLVSADKFLQAAVPPILHSPAYKDHGVLFITFDEAANSDNSGCCTTGPLGLGILGGGRVGLLALSPMIKPGMTTDTPYSHNSLLRTVEDGLGLASQGYLNNAAGDTSMTDLFA